MIYTNLNGKPSPTMKCCFISLVKHTDLAKVFIENYGGALFLDCLGCSCNDFQLIYYTLLNIWMLSFVEDSIEKFIGVPKSGVFKYVCDILQQVSREKITRVAFMIFKNIQDHHSCLELMMDSKLLIIIDVILKSNIKN
jgi:V-type H+-transporting ATPase subunit H